MDRNKTDKIKKPTKKTERNIDKQNEIIRKRWEKNKVEDKQKEIRKTKEKERKMKEEDREKE